MVEIGHDCFMTFGKGQNVPFELYRDLYMNKLASAMITGQLKRTSKWLRVALAGRLMDWMRGLE
jgi:hypothetical protein